MTYGNRNILEMQKEELIDAILRKIQEINPQLKMGQTVTQHFPETVFEGKIVKPYREPDHLVSLDYAVEPVEIKYTTLENMQSFKFFFDDTSAFNVFKDATGWIYPCAVTIPHRDWLLDKKPGETVNVRDKSEDFSPHVLTQEDFDNHSYIIFRFFLSDPIKCSLSSLLSSRHSSLRVLAHWSPSSVFPLCSAPIPIIIALAIALDVGKVVTVSLLYTYWKALSKLMKAYALLAATVTMIITSAGAAGYLTGEFQKSIMGAKEGDLKVAVMKEQQAKYELRKKQIDDQIAALPTKTTVNQRLRLMNGFKAEQKELDTKIAQIDKDLPALQVQQIGTEAKAGPIVAISKALNVPMEEAVSYVIALIIVVFDPLAIFLIISGNFLWARRKADQLVQSKINNIDYPMDEDINVPRPVDCGFETKAEFKNPVIVEPEKPAPAEELKIEPVKSFEDSPVEFPTSPKKNQVFFHTGENLLYIYNGERWVPANSLSFSIDEPKETVYETFEEPQPVVPEPVEAVTVEPEVEPRPTYQQTGLLKPVEVEMPDDLPVENTSEFIPMSVQPRPQITKSSLGIIKPDPATIVNARDSVGFREAAAKK